MPPQTPSVCTDTPIKELPLKRSRQRPWTLQQIDAAVQDGRKIFINEGNVYDMTCWISKHPGGQLAVERLLGQDASDVMRAMHPTETLQNFVPRFCVGVVADAKDSHSDAGLLASGGTASTVTEKSALVNTPSTPAATAASSDHPPLDHPAISRDFRLLHQQLLRDGYYETPYRAYAWEFLRQVVFFAAAIYLGAWNPFPYAWVLSAVLLSMFWHQASFVVHDAGHNGITHRRSYDYLLGALLADGMGGLSIGWWKHSHNVHHIITNHPEHDPDIQLVPFFALSEQYFESIFSSYHNKQLQWNRVWRLLAMIQDKTYYLILAFGRFNLFVQGWLYLALNPNSYARKTEIVLMCFYWTWYSYFLSCLPDHQARILHVLISFIGSSILHVQITLSHFGMSTDDGPEDECFAARQLRTTMDVDCPWWLDWFHGGLQFQALHHLFPQLPRHRLRSIQPFVLALCRKHGLTYTYHSFLECNLMVLSEMRKLAVKAASARV